MWTLRNQMGKAAPRFDAAIFLPKICSRGSLGVHKLQEGSRGLPFKMNKFPPKASKHGVSHTLYRGDQCLSTGCVVRNASPEWAISGIRPTNGSAESAELFRGSSSEPLKTVQSIRAEHTHNFGLRYLTHTHLGTLYMLSEVRFRGNSPLESQSCADLGHSRRPSHTHTPSLFLLTKDIDATNGSFASINPIEKDGNNGPSPRKPAHLENVQGAPVEARRLSPCHSRRSPQCRKTGRSDLRHIQDFRPNSPDQRVPVRMARKGHEAGIQGSRSLAASLGLFPSQTKESTNA